MSEIEKVKSFLETLKYEEARMDQCALKEGVYPFVTISRETGAGGNSAANAILDELNKRNVSFCGGWQKFNQELCHKVAEDPKFKASLTALLNSEYRSHIQDMLEQLIIGSAPQDAVNHRIFEWIEMLAHYGKVILIGRAGVCLTRHLPLGVHIRLIAPLEDRIQRVSTLFKMTLKKAGEYVWEQDSAREKFMRAYFNQNINHSGLYDAVWNTSEVPFSLVAESAVELMSFRFNAWKQEAVKK